MNYSLLITVSIALGWMLSPDSLVIQGNSAGLGIWLFFPAIALGGILSSACVFLLHHPKTSELSNATPSPPTAFIVANRLSLVLFLPTGMLVTAGFTFNETFVYWFPNFGFSFLLLTFILVIHLISEKVAAAVQPLFAGTTLFCLLLLSIVGITGQTGMHPLPPTDTAIPLTVQLSAAALVLFLGYDAGIGQTGKHLGRYHWGTIGAGSILFTLWAMASLANVDPANLASSTVPYSLTARKVLGEPGRIIVGIAIISGTLGCVNALFILANRAMVPLTENVFRRFSAGKTLQNRAYPFIFSVLIGSFMMTGMAGSDALEVYIRSALMLWLLTIGLHCLAATHVLQILGKAITGFGYTLSITVISSTFYLIFSHPKNIQILVFCCFTLAVSTLVAKVLSHLNRKTNLN